MRSVIGAFLRYKLTESILFFDAIPVNVLIVNVIGSFILGLFIILSQQWNIDGKYCLFTAIGFCVSFTAISFLVLDSSNLLENHQYASLVVNILVNVVLSIVALIGGKSLMTTIINN